MQINRLFQIIYILLDREMVTAAELAEKFEVSQRTIYRDIETLSEAGIPVFMTKGHGGGISFLPNFVLNKAVLTTEERADVLSVIKAVRAVDLSGGSEALDKVSTLLGNKNVDWLEVDFSSWGNAKLEEENFRFLKQAVVQKQVVTFQYQSGKSEKTTRAVLPLKLVFKGAAWYLYAFCRLRNEPRFFKLKRILEPQVLSEHFTMEAPEKVLTDSGYVSTQMFTAKLWISKKMAFRIFDEMSEYEETPEGDFICSAPFPDLNTLCSYVGTFGEYCKLLEPVMAVAELKRRLQKFYEMYKDEK